MQLDIVESLKSAIRYLLELANKSTIMLVLLPNENYAFCSNRMVQER